MTFAQIAPPPGPPPLISAIIADDATGGDCVFVGTWNAATKTCTLNNDLTGLEVASDGVTVDGAGHTIFKSSASIGIRLSWRTGVTVKNFVVEGTSLSIFSAAGIYLINSSGNTLENNVVTKSKPGIYLRQSNNNLIVGNTATSNAVAGIQLELGNSNNTIRGNTFNANAKVGTLSSGFGILLAEATNNMVEENTVNGNAIYGIFSTSPIAGIPSNHSNTFARNTVSSNNSHGMVLTRSNSNTVRGNTIQANNGTGLSINSSSGNVAYNNNFVNNNLQAGAPSGNSFNLAAPAGGNYWSNFDEPGEGCSDADGDGFCDTPYVSGLVQDNLPWTVQDGWLAPANAPPMLSGLGQFRVDTSTAIAEGAVTPVSTVTFKATLDDADGDDEKLQVELKPFDEAFDETGLLESGLVSAGSEAMVSREGLGNGDYKWRARAMDGEGNSSSWQEFGSVGNTDFTVRHPVIIVPGILGSWDLPIVGWTIDPILGTYNDLIDMLDGAGYTPEIDLFTHPYDWKLPMTLTSDGLKARIQEIKNGCGCEKVDVIAHSMGGLVARQYAQGTDYMDDIDQLIFLGTPHEGAGVAYLLWEGGEVTPDEFSLKTDRLIELLISGLALTYGYFDNFSFITNEVPSVQDLLPTYDYLKEASDGTLRSYPSNYPVNTNLDLLNSPTSQDKLGERGIRITNIVGDIEPDDGLLFRKDETIGFIRVENRPGLLPMWEHGYPENFDLPIFGDHGLEFTDGDGRVTIESATHGFPSEVIEEDDSGLHQSLPTTAWPKISKALLGVELPIPDEIKFKEKLSELNKLHISVHSPVDIQVIDPLGRRIGTDFTTGDEINEIPLAFYSGVDTEPEFVVIHDPLDGEYQILTQGTGTGGYDFDLTFVGDSITTTQSVSGNTALGVTATFDVSFDSSAPEETTVTPQDTITPTTTASLDGVAGENGWFWSNVEVSLSAEDNPGGVGVYRTEYSLNGGLTWDEYAAPFMVSGEGMQPVLYRSIDFVGNTEDAKTVDVKIDESAPEARMYLDLDAGAFVIEGIDENPTTTEEVGNREFLVKDEAGHTLWLGFQKFKERSIVAQAKLEELRYDDEPEIPVPTNTVLHVWVPNWRGGGIHLLNQLLNVKKAFLVNATYTQQKDETTVLTVEGTGSDKEIDKQTLPGLAFVHLVTDDGALKYEIVQ